MDPVTRIEAIAFDLVMTLVDSRPVSRRALERLVCEYSAKLDIDTLMSAYGRPLPGWLPASIDGALFRTLQSQDTALAVAMPGAGAALAAVRQAGARVVVVTSAPLTIALGMLRAAGLRVDDLHPDAWGAQKVEPLRAESAGRSSETILTTCSPTDAPARSRLASTPAPPGRSELRSNLKI